MSRAQDLQKMHRLYKEETGNREVEPRTLAEWAIARGFKPPVPKSAVDMRRNAN